MSQAVAPQAETVFVHVPPQQWPPLQALDAQSLFVAHAAPAPLLTHVWVDVSQFNPVAQSLFALHWTQVPAMLLLFVSPQT